MADLEIGNFNNVTDKRTGRGTNGATVVTEAANVTSISAMKVRLAALDATSFTPARLATMTENDMLYAIRVRGTDAAGI